MSKRAIIYARVSTDVQRENYSVPSQIAACVEYAEDQDYSLVGERFVDPATGRDVAASGNGAVRAYVDDFTSTQLERPCLDEARAYLERVGFDVVIVFSLDRLARDPYVRRTLELQLEEGGARVEFVQGDYDDSPEGEVRKDLDATFAKWENAKRVERSNRGKKRKAEEGLFVAGRAPYGCTIDETAKGGLAVNSEQAEVVRRIFRLYVQERESIRGVAEVLTADSQAITYSGRNKWAHSTVRRILKNTIYAGYGFYNKHKRNGKRLEKRPREEWIRYETTPLVEEWIFDQAQERLAENKRIRRKQPSRFYVLSGMVFCRKCGRPYHAQTDPAGKNRRKTDGQLYRHRKGAGHCRNHQISARLLVPVVWDEITRILLEPRRLLQGYEESLAQHEQQTARARDHLETLRRELNKVDSKRQNLTSAYIDPDIQLTKDEYVEQKNDLDSEVNALRKRMEAIQERLERIPTPADLKTVESFAAEVRGALADEDKLTKEKKRALLEALHVKVFVNSDDTLDVEGWFGKSAAGLLGTASRRYAIQRQPLRAPA